MTNIDNYRVKGISRADRLEEGGDKCVSVVFSGAVEVLQNT